MPDPCQQNVLDVPVTPSVAAPTDYVMGHLPDGSTFLRPWAQWAQTVPEDVEMTVTESGGDVNNGDDSVTIEAFKGWRTRLYRNGLPQAKDTSQPTYFSFDPLTGEYSFTPALSTGEFLQFQAY
jgi:hypothetical protein